MVHLNNRLVIITLDFKPQTGGVQEYLYQIAKRLSSTYQVTIITSTSGKLSESVDFQRLVLPNNSPFSFLKKIRQLRPNQLIVGHAHPRLLGAAWLWGKYATITYGNDFLAAQDHWHKPLFNWLLQQAKPLLTISKSSQSQLKNHGLPLASIICPGTDPNHFRPNHRTTHNQIPRLLTVGRLVPRKGIDTMLQALPQVLQETAVIYQIAGDGPDRPRLEKLAHELGISQVVHFMGRISDESLPQTYADADIFVMPNRGIIEKGSLEGFGIVFLEASASGLPVIAGRSGGAVEAVQHEETGLLVPPDDIDALATAVLSLIRNPKRRHKMAQTGRRWVETEMNWDRAAKQFTDLLDKNADS